MSSIILEAKSLTKEYKQTLALDHINLQIKKGKIYGFIGQNGAGKTTFLRLVTGGLRFQQVVHFLYGEILEQKNCRNSVNELEV